LVLARPTPMKDNNSKFIKYIFILICILELTSHVFDIRDMHLFTKPLLIPVLMVFFRRALTTQLNSSFMLAILALIFSWIGDVSLMYEDNDPIYFLIGLSGFSIAQILYIFSFKKARYNDETVISIKYQLLFLLPFVVSGAVILWFLVPAADELAYPLIIYSLLLLGMVISAILRLDQTKQSSFNQVFIGAVLFMISDSLLGFNKFLLPMENAQLFILLTYILAQWNIVNGLLKHFNEA
jgi:uncharacterized membrane protein YhhN